MNQKRNFKLLSKATFVYLIFTFIAFFGSAIFLIHRANQLIESEIERKFEKIERRIKYKIENGMDADKIKIVTPIADSTNVELTSVYKDTLIYNSELQEMQSYRKKVIIFRANGKYYKLSLLSRTDDFDKLRQYILQAIIPSFIFLAILIVLFNYFLSDYFLKPLHKILAQMKTYKVGETAVIKKVDTTTAEFVKMQELFHNMLERIEQDYQNLKEYTENMAHEIQTPLTIIRNKTENLIADERVMEHHADSVKIIYDETNHLSKLGNTLNLLTKIENREFNNAIHIQTKPVIEKHIEAIKELAGLKSLEIKTELSDEHQLFIDPFLLDIVLKNLLRNAVRYGTDDGEITIKTTPNSLSICNYGEPLTVPPEKLFERFHRINGTQKSLGLGLSLVKKICELNDLSIDYIYEGHQHIITIRQ
jgi:signal transduction histidine kinase